MIVVRLMGGLGNQMFQYALGRRLSSERRTTLGLDLSWFASQSLWKYGLDWFRTGAESVTPELLTSFTSGTPSGLTARVSRSLERLLPYYRKRVVTRWGGGFDANVLRARRDVLLVGYWQSEKYFQPVSAVLRREFLPREPLSAEAQSWLAQTSAGETASVHVRRGDYATDPKTGALHPVCTIDYYRVALSLLQSRRPNVRFFVFSDDLPWVRQSFRSPFPFTTVELTGQDRDLEEFVLMASCKHHVIANSSYSWWAAWLDERPDSIVVAPRRWFGDPSRSTQDLIPERWILT